MRESSNSLRWFFSTNQIRRRWTRPTKEYKDQRNKGLTQVGKGKCAGRYKIAYQRANTEKSGQVQQCTPVPVRGCLKQKHLDEINRLTQTYGGSSRTESASAAGNG